MKKEGVVKMLKWNYPVSLDTPISPYSIFAPSVFNIWFHVDHLYVENDYNSYSIVRIKYNGIIA